MKIGIAFIETLEDIPAKKAVVDTVQKNISTLIDSEQTAKPYIIATIVIGLCVVALLVFLFKKKKIKLPILFCMI